MGDCIVVSVICNLVELFWKSFGVDIVFECMGFFISCDKVVVYLQVGVGKVLILVFGKDVDVIVVYGVNYEVLCVFYWIVLNVFCIINCLVLVVQVLYCELGIEYGLMIIIYVYINDQNFFDVYYLDLYCVCLVIQLMIFIKIGVVEVVGLVLLEFVGKFIGLVVWVLVINVLLVDFIVQVVWDISVDEVNCLLCEVSEGFLVFGYNIQLLVLVDFNYDLCLLIFDVNYIKVSGWLVKVMVWYDNEWGFFNCMLDSVLVLVVVCD